MDILVNDGKIDNEDIIIRTTHEELFEIIENESDVKKSVSSGKIFIEKVANDFILFSKGYLELYNGLDIHNSEF